MYTNTYDNTFAKVWQITIIGSTMGIPDTVMGLTFVAAGVSVPDALSSIAVIKEGYGDMAVSNAVGSNVFDILICLGLPWFIQTTIIDTGGHVNVISKGKTIFFNDRYHSPDSVIAQSERAKDFIV